MNKFEYYGLKVCGTILFTGGVIMLCVDLVMAPFGTAPFLGSMASLFGGWQALLLEFAYVLLGVALLELSKLSKPGPNDSGSSEPD